MSYRLTRFVISILITYCLLSPSVVFSESQDAPVFSLPGQNKTIDLTKYRGKVVYLDFWASWCDPCKRSFPWMNKLQEQYGRDGLEIIAVNLDSSRQDAEEFLSKVPATFDVAFDDRGKTAKIYKLKAMPSSYLIDRQGKLVHKSLGYRKEEKEIIESKIQHLTANKLVAKR